MARLAGPRSPNRSRKISSWKSWIRHTTCSAPKSAVNGAMPISAIYFPIPRRPPDSVTLSTPRRSVSFRLTAWRATDTANLSRWLRVSPERQHQRNKKACQDICVVAAAVSAAESTTKALGTSASTTDTNTQDVDLAQRFRQIARDFRAHRRHRLFYDLGVDPRLLEIAPGGSASGNSRASFCLDEFGSDRLALVARTLAGRKSDDLVANGTGFLSGRWRRRRDQLVLFHFRRQHRARARDQSWLFHDAARERLVRRHFSARAIDAFATLVRSARRQRRALSYPRLRTLPVDRRYALRHLWTLRIAP